MQPHLHKLKYAEVMMHYLKDNVIFLKLNVATVNASKVFDMMCTK